jgi:hypothetical protein
MLMVLGGLSVAVSQPCLSGKHYRTAQLMSACTRLAVQFTGTLAGKAVMLQDQVEQQWIAHAGLETTKFSQMQRDTVFLGCIPV